jgi:hypothetical protein
MFLVIKEYKSKVKGLMMKPFSNVILYSQATNGVRSEFCETVEAVSPSAHVEIFSTISDLSKRLHKPGLNFPIIVLMVVNREDLENIVAIQNLLFDSRIILILPDKEDDTMALGHTLRPRFVSYRDNSFREVGAVLDKMINRPEIGKA